MARRDERDEGTALARTCAVTRTVRPAAEMIRFVRGPDGTVVADLAHRLPGRGVWIGGERATVAEAVRRKVFSRAFKAAAEAPADLAERVAAGLEQAALEILSLANKAGRVVTGFAKVEAALGRGEAVAVLNAADAGGDGVRKLAAAARRGGGDTEMVSLFAGARLDLALGRANVVHAALLAGPVSNAFLERAARFGRYRGGGTAEAGRRDDDAGRPAGTDLE
ncbi:MAG TPA: RNA-binding protein [Hyphomicrobiales bacterium]|nr:RNA-binding protein [Hyphomicrobiales bacterium]